MELAPGETSSFSAPFAPSGALRTDVMGWYRGALDRDWVPKRDRFAVARGHRVYGAEGERHPHQHKRAPCRAAFARSAELAREAPLDLTLKSEKRAHRIVQQVEGSGAGSERQASQKHRLESHPCHHRFLQPEDGVSGNQRQEEPLGSGPGMASGSFLGRAHISEHRQKEQVVSGHKPAGQD